MIDRNRNLEATPRGVPTLGLPTTEVTEEGCEQHDAAERKLADAVRRAIADCPPGDEESAGRAVDGVLAIHNAAVAATHGERVPDASQMTFAGYKAVVKVRFTDGKGARWGFDVAGRKDSYMSVMFRGPRPAAAAETPAVRRGILQRLSSLLF